MLQGQLAMFLVESLQEAKGLTSTSSHALPWTLPSSSRLMILPVVTALKLALSSCNE